MPVAGLAELLGGEFGDEAQHARRLGEAEQVLDVVDQPESLLGLIRITEQPGQELPDLALVEGLEMAEAEAGTSSAFWSRAVLTCWSDSKWCVRLVTTTLACPAAAWRRVSKWSVALVAGKPSPNPSSTGFSILDEREPAECREDRGKVRLVNDL